ARPAPPARGDVPQLNRSPMSHGHSATVAREAHRLDRLSVNPDTAHQPARRQITLADLAILASEQDRAAVRRDCHGQHLVPVPGRVRHLLVAGRHIPDADPAVRRAGGEGLSIRGKRDGPGAYGVARENPRHLSGRQVPELERGTLALRSETLTVAG